MIIHQEIALEDFEAWSGGEDTLDRVWNAGKMRDLEMILEDMYPDGMDTTDLNDLLRFESDAVYGWLGMKTDEEIEQERSEREAKINALREMMITDDPSVFCNLWVQECEYDCSLCPMFDAGNCEDPVALSDFREKIIETCNECIDELGEEND